ncbi:DNA polymerase IV [Halobacteriales archaeon SW_12_71_31]|nr:MAG: DNA polymerase IV [Halobacteriales archaeon SW_12_71_31]
MVDERLPGAPDPEDRDQIVVHADLDCFYAACERLREPALEEEPVVVGMGYEPGDLSRVEDADDGEPAAHYRPVDMEFYGAVGEEVRAVLRDCADVVRTVSIDEAYLDVTDRTDWDVVEGFARHLKQRVEREVGVTLSVGVAPTMSAAKVASDHDKPDGLVVVPPGSVREFLAPLPVESVHGVGPVRARRLRESGIETAGDLAETPPSEVADRFGERGRAIARRARGHDDRTVTPRGRPKSLSRESAFPEAVEDPAPKRERVRTLARAVAERARREGAVYRTVGVKAVEPPFDVSTRERSLAGAVSDADLVEEVALDLFAEFADEEVRKVGVRVSNLGFPDGEQARLDGFDGPNTESGATRRVRGVGDGGRSESVGDRSEPGRISRSRRSRTAATRCRCPAARGRGSRGAPRARAARPGRRTASSAGRTVRRRWCRG